MKKEVYSQPVSEIFELKLLGSVLQTVSPTFSSKGTELMTTDEEEDF